VTAHQERVTSQPLVEVRSGRIRGAVERGVARFLGIPYAAPPFGENRFELPRPAPGWEGELNALGYGPTPPQTPYSNGLDAVLRSVRIDGEQILNLNIWTPAAALGGGALPVMFWIYGGALTRGSNALELYDGETFARDGVVFVAPNYRLGIEGFGELDGAPDNRGLADVLAALAWVRDNIAAFGGDPGNVTVFGQSAGGALVSMLLAVPQATGLFGKAIIQSAPMGRIEPPKKGGVAAKVAQKLGIPRTRAAFAARSADELAIAQTDVMSGNPLGGGAFYAPIPGDELLPVDAWTAQVGGAGSDVPVMIGSTSEEHRLWLVPTGFDRKINRLMILPTLLFLKVKPSAFRLYRRNRPGESAGMVLGAILMDLICRDGMNKFADARLRQGGRTFVYELAWRSPHLDLGAAHGIDVPFVFDALHSTDAHMLLGDSAPQSLADEMHSAWVRFASTGDPGWPQWAAERPVMVFDSPSGRVVNSPREEERLAVERPD
jgi:para-nitrobenzyl esterase